MAKYMQKLEKEKQPVHPDSEFNVKGVISELEFANQKSG